MRQIGIAWLTRGVDTKAQKFVLHKIHAIYTFRQAKHKNQGSVREERETGAERHRVARVVAT